MKTCITILCSLIVLLSFSQNQSEDTTVLLRESTKYLYNLNEIIYFSEDWEIASNEEYKYYRTSKISVLKYQNIPLIEITDHFKNDEVQMTGYLFDADTNFATGLWSYYESNGKISQYRLYEYETFINEFSHLEAYAKLIEKPDCDNICLHIMFFPKKLKFIGYRRNDGKRIGKWRIYKKNGKYIVCDFKDGKAPTVLRLYDKNDNLIKKGYYNPKLVQ